MVGGSGHVPRVFHAHEVNYLASTADHCPYDRCLSGVALERRWDHTHAWPAPFLQLEQAVNGQIPVGQIRSSLLLPYMFQPLALEGLEAPVPKLNPELSMNFFTTGGVILFRRAWLSHTG